MDLFNRLIDPFKYSIFSDEFQQNNDRILYTVQDKLNSKVKLTQKLNINTYKYLLNTYYNLFVSLDETLLEFKDCKNTNLFKLCNQLFTMDDSEDAPYFFISDNHLHDRMLLYLKHSPVAESLYKPSCNWLIKRLSVNDNLTDYIELNSKYFYFDLQFSFNGTSFETGIENRILELINYDLYDINENEVALIYSIVNTFINKHIGAIYQHPEDFTRHNLYKYISMNINDMFPNKDQYDYTKLHTILFDFAHTHEIPTDKIIFEDCTYILDFVYYSIIWNVPSYLLNSELLNLQEPFMYSDENSMKLNQIDIIEYLNEFVLDSEYVKFFGGLLVGSIYDITNNIISAIVLSCNEYTDVLFITEENYNKHDNQFNMNDQFVVGDSPIHFTARSLRNSNGTCFNIVNNKVNKNICFKNVDCRPSSDEVMLTTNYEMRFKSQLHYLNVIETIFADTQLYNGIVDLIDLSTYNYYYTYLSKHQLFKESPTLSDITLMLAGLMFPNNFYREDEYDEFTNQNPQNFADDDIFEEHETFINILKSGQPFTEDMVVHEWAGSPLFRKYSFIELLIKVTMVYNTVVTFSIINDSDYFDTFINILKELINLLITPTDLYNYWISRKTKNMTTRKINNTINKCISGKNISNIEYQLKYYTYYFDVSFITQHWLLIDHFKKNVEHIEWYIKTLIADNNCLENTFIVKHLIDFKENMLQYIKNDFISSLKFGNTRYNEDTYFNCIFSNSNNIIVSLIKQEYNDSCITLSTPIMDINALIEILNKCKENSKIKPLFIFYGGSYHGDLYNNFLNNYYNN
jgi:hypothetical protein